MLRMLVLLCVCAIAGGYACGKHAGGCGRFTEINPAFEVTRDGSIVWEFYNPHRAGDQDEFIATLFRVVRIPEGHAPSSYGL